GRERAVRPEGDAGGEPALPHRGRALAGGPPDPARGAHHLGARGPRPALGRRLRGLPVAGERTLARFPAMWPLGHDRAARGVPAHHHGLLRPRLERFPVKIHSLDYVRLESTVVDEWRTFAHDVLGAAVADGPGGSVLLRLDDRPFRLAIIPGDQDRLVGAGF